ncbi:hypothetical protein KG089_02630 [Carnobacteriaceae bacterium zg-ZUI252]|nr:hypothetical protein [Carnobacteriaceae bacterium zg-ZUI252]QTU83374.1 hypothetical protein J7S27_02330 [Carnobacteriaceae bacterium zg-C25]
MQKVLLSSALLIVIVSFFIGSHILFYMPNDKIHNQTHACLQRQIHENSNVYGWIHIDGTPIMRQVFNNPSGFQEVKGYDGIGAGHTNSLINKKIDTPHVHDKGTPGDIRIPESWEIPGN